MIEAFHHQGGVVRRRVIWVKALASLSTMQIGGALGSWVGLHLQPCRCVGRLDAESRTLSTFHGRATR